MSTTRFGMHEQVPRLAVRVDIGLPRAVLDGLHRYQVSIDRGSMENDYRGCGADGLKALYWTSFSAVSSPTSAKGLKKTMVSLPSPTWQPLIHRVLFGCPPPHPQRLNRGWEFDLRTSSVRLVLRSCRNHIK